MSAYSKSEINKIIEKICINPSCLIYKLPDDLINNKKFAIKSIKHGRTLNYINIDLFKDEDIVFEAYKLSPCNLKYAHIDLLKDEHFLYILDNFCKIERECESFYLLPFHIQIKIYKDPDYLSTIKPVEFKPAKKINKTYK